MFKQNFLLGRGERLTADVSVMVLATVLARTFPRSALSRLERRADYTFVVPNMIETMKFAKNLTLAQSRLPSKAFKY